MRAGRPVTKGLWRAVALVGLALVLTACGRTDFPQDALSPDGPIARSQDRLWNIVFPIAVVVFVLVQGLILVAVWRFRARGDEADLPKQVAGNTRLELAWTIVPALILAVIAVPTVQGIFELAGEPDEGERLDVSVVGKQYWWQFEYPDTGVLTANELVIPVDTPVWVTLDGIAEYEVDETTTQDRDLVMHSFWVPRLAGKIDYVPNYERRLTIQADEPGTYAGQCAEFCGLSHANMRFVVIALEQGEFEDWLEARQQPAEEHTDGELALGQEIFGANCVACHQLLGHPANGGARVGPDLTHFASRELFAGAIFENADEERLRAWIRNPQAEKPGAQMLPFPNLSEEELDALIAYLYSLE